jgi:hypothetical protein
MTKKNYELAAAIVRDIKNEDSRLHACLLFMRFFGPDNTKFDADRFRTACLAAVRTGKPVRARRRTRPSKVVAP